MNDLPELRDIHLPEPIGLFPLGYGFLLLMGLAVCLMFLIPYLRYKYLKGKKKYAFDLLADLTTANMENVCRISELLRRICKIRHKKAVALYGADWASFLNKTGSAKLSDAQMTLLINAPYAPATNEVNQQDFMFVKNFAKQWVETNL